MLLRGEFTVLRTTALHFIRMLRLDPSYRLCLRLRPRVVFGRFSSSSVFFGPSGVLFRSLGAPCEALQPPRAPPWGQCVSLVSLWGVLGGTLGGP